MYYRLRQPRPLRGYQCRIAKSEDGFRFSDIWSAPKDAFPTASMERACLRRCPGGVWRLYLGFVDPEDSRWRIDMLEAESPEDFRIGQRRPVLTASSTATEGVKDPWLTHLGGRWLMFVSCAPALTRPSAQQLQALHTSGDAFATGISRSATGLAVSSDGTEWEWMGLVLDVGAGWDAYAARLTCLLHAPQGEFAFYDAAGNLRDNYEEKTGLLSARTDPDATGLFLERLSLQGPVLASPWGSGSLRYLDAVHVGDQIFFYYECARADGSHELRATSVPAVPSGGE